MIHFDEEKLKGLHTASELPDSQQGKKGRKAVSFLNRKREPVTAM